MYAKLFSSMFDGSLATRGPWQALVTFQQLLVLADRYGIVDMTLPAIHRRTTVPMEVLELGIAELLKPDPDSRTPDHEGRRIMPLDPSRAWGWQITNFAAFRQIRTAEERRDYQRTYMRDWRDGKKRGQRKPAKAKGNGADHAPDDSPVIERIPIIGGEEWNATQDFAAELTRLYPAVDVPQTLREIRGWCIGNPGKLKTARGVRKFVVSWIAREQDKPA